MLLILSSPTALTSDAISTWKSGEPNVEMAKNNRFVNDRPYNKKINISTVEYLHYKKALIGINEWACGGEKLRYLPVTTKGNIELILVPMDCADFPYRFYLLSIVDNAIISTLYVEGEWSELGETESDNFKEVTSFHIDEDYKITVLTGSTEGSEVLTYLESVYTINSRGEFSN
ncbi:hypothetical protein N9J26_00680 [bacterium]|nr:hypothetical protein [bacterium]